MNLTTPLLAAGQTRDTSTWKPVLHSRPLLLVCCRRGLPVPSIPARPTSVSPASIAAPVMAERLLHPLAVTSSSPPQRGRPGFHVPPPLASAVAAILSAVVVPPPAQPPPPPPASVSPAAAAAVATRRHLLALAASSVAAAALLPAPPAAAISWPGSAKGTKRDGGYRRCLSSCLSRCMAPPRDGGGAKERSVCVVECKDECATTAEQL